MGKTRTAVRILLAIALGVFGADMFLHFMPKPEPAVAGGDYLKALHSAGYIFPAVGIAFLATSVCLLANRVALGLLILTPITVNILLYHYQFDLKGSGAGLVIAVLQILLLWLHRADFTCILRAATPQPKAK
jgi:putative oxidoreductase